MLMPKRTALQEMGRNILRLATADWRDRKWRVIPQIIVSLLISVLPFVQSGTLALLINTVTNPANAEAAWIALVVFLAIAGSFLPEYVYALKGYVDKRHWLAMQTDYEIAFHRKKAQIDVCMYEDPKFLNLLQKLEEEWIYPLLRLTDAQYLNIQNIIEVIVASAILITLDPWLLVLVIGASLPTFIVEAKYGYGMWGIYDANAPERRRYESYRHYFSRNTDLLEIRLFQSANFFLNRMKEMFTGFLSQQAKLERRKLGWQMLAVSIAAAGVGLAVFLIVNKALTGAIQVGTMAFLLYAIRDLRNACSGFLLSLGGQYKDSLIATDSFKILDAGPRLPVALHPRNLMLDGPPLIELQNVSFSYPGTDRMILKDVSLKIEPGERLGLVGINGAGKTTLVKLLCRIYDPTSGRVLINGVDIRDADVETWWNAIAVLFQDYANFKMNAKDVIAMGRASESGADAPLARLAAEQSGASEFIEEWKEGYEQMIGRDFDGLELSKGQLQKIALARVFYRKPKLMILDEPTASIDAEAERKIFEQLENLPRDASSILISHRFSTLRNADRICILKDGTVSELGTHEELMKNGGEYARLFRLQADGYKEELP